MIKPSNFHNNRRWHNWIVYDINDKFLQKYSKYLKGHLVDLGCGDAPYKKYFLCSISCGYEAISMVEHVLSKREHMIEKKDFMERITIVFKILEEEYSLMQEELYLRSRGKITSRKL